MRGRDARTGLSDGQLQALAGTRFTVHWVDATGSTNDDLRAAAAEGAPEGSVLLAEYRVTAITAQHMSITHAVTKHVWQIPVPRATANR